MSPLLTKSCILLCAFFSSSMSRTMSRDEFIQTLSANGIPQYQLNTWACIAEHESHFDTNAYNPTTGDHGIFQISQIYWCSPPGTGCGMTCASLHDDDIRNDIACAKIVLDETRRIFGGNGFQAWTTYQYCQNL